MFAIGLPLFLLGALTWLGTVVSAHVTSPEVVPVFYRRRVIAFARNSRLLAYAAAVLTAVGVVLLIGWP